MGKGDQGGPYKADLIRKPQGKYPISCRCHFSDQFARASKRNKGFFPLFETDDNAPDGADLHRKRCARCSKPFGLVRHNHAGQQFCSVLCMEERVGAVHEAATAKLRWYEFFYRRAFRCVKNSTQ